ncbi:histidine kinase [Paenibacillus sp. GYB004]|uniref:sensor histidine kinase n=1 Tax=Paenibacillus sp. GYB004 TaxID=2994393 RepID=UPI002F96342D
MTLYDIGIKGKGNLEQKLLTTAAEDRTDRLAHAALIAVLLLPPVLGVPVLDGNVVTVYAGFAFLLWSLQAIHADNDLQPTDHRRPIVWLAIACTAYLLGPTGLFDPYRIVSLASEALSLHSQLSDRLPYVGFVNISVSVCGLAAISIRMRLLRQEAKRSAAELHLKNQELAQLRHSLEQTVELRVAALEKASRSLASSFREKAETLAEVAVLEERNRIAYEIHDTVGYTLTSAIVQLEAAKKIAEQQDRVPWDKLELLSGLMRKGMEDVGRAVKLIRSDDAETMTLEAALRELIQYTEDTMEIAIETDISLSSNTKPGRLTEQVLYHALQEGLTNGARHGKCNRVRFSLRSSNGMLMFRLVSDGEPYGSAVPGFGLSSMIERVQLLGGRVDIRSSADAEGEPVGCELSIDLPLL